MRLDARPPSAATRAPRRRMRAICLRLVGWLPATIGGHGGMLSIEACPCGWWSIAATPDQQLVVSLFTSAAMMKSARASPRRLVARGAVHRSIYTPAGRPEQRRIRSHGRIFPAFPSISSMLHGPGWIAIGDAAAAFDPLCGQGVEFALESAFRAFEAMSVRGRLGKPRTALSKRDQ